MKSSIFWRRQSLRAVAMALMALITACGVAARPEVVIPPAANPQTAASSAPSATVAASPSPQAATAAPSATQTIAPTMPATEEPTLAPTETPAPPTAEPTPTEPALAPFDPALAATLQSILDETVADGYIPGATLSVSIAGQEPWSGASGVADRQQGRPMEPQTNVRIASISKIFTAVVVLQLAEEGAIDLDAPLSTYLPDLVPTGDAITVRSLLQHTTGLYDYLEDRNFAARAYQNPQQAFAPRDLVAYATRFPPAFRPGAPGSWDYSSTNYVILGMVVEQVTGNSLAQEMRQRIFEPLDLQGTFFQPDEAVPETAARGYSRATDQTNVAMSFAFATANLVSTAPDVRRFLEALVGGELLEPATQEAMFTFVSGKGQYNMPALGYGLGIMRNVLPVGGGRSAEASTVVGHIGGFGGFRSAVWSAPDGSITVALGVNQASTDPNLLATRAYAAVLAAQGR